MTKGGVTDEGAAAAGLRIIRMGADADDFSLARAGSAACACPLAPAISKSNGALAAVEVFRKVRRLIVCCFMDGVGRELAGSGFESLMATHSSAQLTDAAEPHSVQRQVRRSHALGYPHRP